MDHAFSIMRRLGMLAASFGLLAAPLNAQPRARDGRLVVELFAEHPQVVTPTGLAIDRRGRVFVAESHTHFRPADYDGPERDRILVFEDTDEDGRADRKAIFHEGFTHVMDIEFHHDGSLYVATRRDIHRMRDTDGDGGADEITPIVKLDTEGDYPHNGLSGLAFDFEGRLNFGLGENLGVPYTLIGSDEVRISGGGEGGSTYVCAADGNGLRRTSTGWWNPYGMCVDAFGRIFGTDNDPGESPPCRLIQVIEGADYGYEYRYGRTGLHPLICWNGEIPGTLPMISGTGEAPCHIVAYESAAFPREYLGNLFVPCWADHRVERYTITQRSDKGLVDVERDVLIEGPDDFRPVGIDVAPDGSVYISDWVSSSYTLHKQGRIWRIKASPASDEVPSAKQPPRQGRDSSASDLADLIGVENALGAKEDDPPHTGLQRLKQRLQLDLREQSSESDAIALRVLAAKFQGRSSEDLPVRAALLRQRAARPNEAAELITNSDDPLLLHSAIEAVAAGLRKTDANLAEADRGRLILLAARRNEELRSYFAEQQLGRFLTASDPDLRFLAVKWIADEVLGDYRPDLEGMLNASDLDYRLFRAIVAALQRLDGQRPSDRPPTELLLAKIRDENAPLAIRQLCLRLIEGDAKGLQTEDFKKLIEHSDETLRLEAVRTLAATSLPERSQALAMIAGDSRQPTSIRATALAGLAVDATSQADLLIEFAVKSSKELQPEAFRSLVGVELSERQRGALSRLAGSNEEIAEAVRRLVSSEAFPSSRPEATDLAAWKKLLHKGGNIEAGERIFFGAHVGTCSKCHAIEGRGMAIGPDLSTISRRLETERDRGVDWLLETILQPSKHMAPQYTPWQIVTTDGKTLVGLPRRKGGNQEAYLGLDGKEFTVKKPDIEFHREIDKSIMPDGLLQNLTREELNHLFAYLTHIGQLKPGVH